MLCVRNLPDPVEPIHAGVGIPDNVNDEIESVSGTAGNRLACFWGHISGLSAGMFWGGVGPTLKSLGYVRGKLGPHQGVRNLKIPEIGFLPILGGAPAYAAPIYKSVFPLPPAAVAAGVPPLGAFARIVEDVAGGLLALPPAFRPPGEDRP